MPAIAIPRAFPVDHTPAVDLIVRLQSTSTAETQVPATSLERALGEAVARAARALAAGVWEYRNGNVTTATKLRAADLVTELFMLRRMMVGHLDFDGIAHQYGRQALSEVCGGQVGAVEQRVIDELVNGVVDTVRKVAKLELN
jgi:hypothetical protein